MIYAVIDTNVLVSALFTKNPEVATIRVLNALLEGEIIPLYNNEIIAEYKEVLQCVIVDNSRVIHNFCIILRNLSLVTSIFSNFASVRKIHE